MIIAPRVRLHSAGAWSLAASLLLTLAGCGGGPSEGVDDAIVVPEPGTNLTPGASAAPDAPTTAGTGSVTPTAATPAAAAAPAAAEGWGTLRGRVVLGGAAPQPKVLVAKGDPNVKDAAVCAAQTIESQALIVDPATQGVANALVYIPKPTAVSPEAQSAAAQASLEFDQKNCVFRPHVLPIMKGATVLIKSSDPVQHNVNSKLDNTKFNESIPPGVSKPVVVKATERAPAQIVCDIHSWMKAWWHVIDSPYFAVTDAQGNFEIKNVPAGTQKVVLWQEAATPTKGFITSSTGEAVTIQADAETTKDFTIDPGKLKPES